MLDDKNVVAAILASKIFFFPDKINKFSMPLYEKIG